MPGTRSPVTKGVFPGLSCSHGKARAHDPRVSSSSLEKDRLACSSLHCIACDFHLCGKARNESVWYAIAWKSSFISSNSIVWKDQETQLHAILFQQALLVRMKYGVASTDSSLVTMCLLEKVLPVRMSLRKLLV